MSDLKKKKKKSGSKTVNLETIFRQKSERISPLHLVLNEEREVIKNDTIEYQRGSSNRTCVIHYIIDGTGSMNHTGNYGVWVKTDTPTPYKNQCIAFEKHLEKLCEQPIRIYFSVSMLRNAELMPIIEFKSLNKKNKDEVINKIKSINATGLTSLCAGILQGIEKCEKFKEECRNNQIPVFPPLQVVFSDFCSSESDLTQEKIDKIYSWENEKCGLNILGGTSRECTYSLTLANGEVCSISRKKLQRPFDELKYMDLFFDFLTGSIGAAFRNDANFNDNGEKGIDDDFLQEIIDTFDPDIL